MAKQNIKLLEGTWFKNNDCGLLQSHLDSISQLSRNEIHLKKRDITIGRGNDSDIVIDDTQVTRYHCMVHEQQGRFYLRDISGRINPTYLKKRDELKYKPVDKETEIQEGDKIRIGRTRLLFE